MEPKTKRKSDLRVERTRKHLREAFLHQARDKWPDEMKISELAEEAEIARKTVYLHYRNIDDIADDICDRLTAGIIPQLTGDMAGDIEVIYTFLDSADSSVHKLLFGGGTLGSRRDFSMRYSHLMPSGNGTQTRSMIS